MKSTLLLLVLVVVAARHVLGFVGGVDRRRNEVALQSTPNESSRRQFVGATAATLFIPQIVNGIMTDETSSYATPSLGSSYTQQSFDGFVNSANNVAKPAPMAPSDEITLTLTKADLQSMQGGFGLELGEVEFRTNFRVVVKSVEENSLAAKAGIQPGWIVVSVDGNDGERTNAAGVAVYFSKAVKAVLNQPDGSDKAQMTLTFRDPSVFRSELKNLGQTNSVSTKVAPAGDTTQRYADGSLRPGASVTEQQDQVVTVPHHNSYHLKCAIDGRLLMI